MMHGREPRRKIATTTFASARMLTKSFLLGLRASTFVS